MQHKTEPSVRCYRLFRSIGVPLMRLLFHPTILGAEQIPTEGAVILAGNHLHALDPLIVDCATKRTVRTLAKKELHDGLFGCFFRAIGSIPVDLHAKANPAARSAAAEVLRSGAVLNLSPEAKRNRTNALLLPFRFGAVSLSQKTGAPIVPYAIYGTYRPFTHGVTIRFGTPMVATNPLPEANAALFQAVAQLLQTVMPPAVFAQKQPASNPTERSQNA